MNRILTSYFQRIITSHGPLLQRSDCLSLLEEKRIAGTAPVGLLTIGQSPRTQLVGQLKKEMGWDGFFLERGALDSFSHGQVTAHLSPSEKEEVLVTWMGDGLEVRVGKEKILPHLIEAMTVLYERGASWVALLCTGYFPDLSRYGQLLEPFFLIEQQFLNLGQKGRLGVMIPDEAQSQGALDRWQGRGESVTVRPLSPGATWEKMEEASEELVGCSKILLDCIGYSQEWEKRIQALTGAYVILPLSLLATAIKKYV